MDVQVRLNLSCPQARSQMEALKAWASPSLYFHPNFVQMTSNGPGQSISNKTTCPLSNDRSACANAQADQSLLCAN